MTVGIMQRVRQPNTFQVHFNPVLERAAILAFLSMLGEKSMRKINTKDVAEELWTSPKGKFGGAGREISVGVVLHPQSFPSPEVRSGRLPTAYRWGGQEPVFSELEGIARELKWYSPAVPFRVARPLCAIRASTT
jgi:hypothetical protein